MADKLVTLQDENKQPIYPETRASVVKTTSGSTIETELAGKQPVGDYATKEELSSSLSSKLDVSGKAASATVADSANSVLGSAVSGAVAEATHASTADTATSATTASTATTATNASNDGSGNPITSTYATKTELSGKVDASAIADMETKTNASATYATKAEVEPLKSAIDRNTDRGFAETLTNLPVDKRVINVMSNTATTLSLAGEIPQGNELHIILTTTTGSYTQPLPNDGTDFICMNGDSFEVAANSYNEISILSVNGSSARLIAVLPQQK